MTTILLAEIHPPKFDSRVNVALADIPQLAKSIEIDGQTTPIEVIALPEGGYERVSGGRRMEALKLLGRTEVNATILELDEANAAMRNALENIQRKNLTTYETARVCAYLRELGWKGKDIKERLGLSESHISNLAVCFVKLPDYIKDAWAKQDPAADVNFMRNLVTYKNDDGKTVERTKEEIDKLWSERVVALSPAVDAGDGPEEDEETDGKEEKEEKEVAVPPYRVPVGRYKALLKALKNGKHPQIAIEAVRYAVGEVEKVKGLTVGEPIATKPIKVTNGTKK